MHFKKENAPEGSTERCTDNCRVEKECPYSAKKIYLNMNKTGWPVSVITDEISYKGRLKALREGPYGRCVYKCGNNVVDHQVVMIEFEGGATASFTMSGFTHNVGERRTRVMGTMGEAICDSRKLEVFNFRNGKKKVYRFTTTEGSVAGMHFGGDFELIKDFIKAVRRRDESYLSSTLDVSIKSHILAFEAEKSRMQKQTILLK